MKKNELVEWAEVYGYLYGTPRHFVERELAEGYDVVLNIDVQGGGNIKKAFPSSVLIFILPPSSAALEKRIRERGTDAEDEIRKRLESARKEFEASGEYEYYVVNDTIEESVGRLKAIMQAERCRRERFSGRITI
jgi:guanylate kinase